MPSHESSRDELLDELVKMTRARDMLAEMADRLIRERDRAVETRENANAVSVRHEGALRRIVENLDGCDPDGNIFPAAALRIAREALGSRDASR